MVKGIDNIIKNIKAFGKDAEKHIDKTISDNVKVMVADAKNRAPVDLGKLQQSIDSEKIKDLSYRMYVGKPAQKYAPYVEFGTGNRVSLSYLKEIGLPNSYAMKFKGKGVKQVNLTARPYFFPAIIKGQNTLKQDLKDLLQDLTKKYSK